VSLDFVKKKKQLWWYPYDHYLHNLLEKSLAVFYHHKLKEKARSLVSLFSHLPRIKAGSPLLNYIKSIPRFFRK